MSTWGALVQSRGHHRRGAVIARRSEASIGVCKAADAVAGPFACIGSIQVFHEKRLFRAVDRNGTVYADNVYLKSVFEGISCTDLIFKEGLCPKQR